MQSVVGQIVIYPHAECDGRTWQLSSPTAELRVDRSDWTRGLTQEALEPDGLNVTG